MNVVQMTNSVFKIMFWTCCALTLPLALITAERNYQDSRHDERDLTFPHIFRFAAGHFTEKQLLGLENNSEKLR